MANQQKLREGFNQVVITGMLKEKKLKIDTFKSKQDGTPYTAIAGELVVKVGEHDEHKVKLFSRQMTKSDNESKLFKAYKTVMEEYISMADIAALPAEEREEVYPTRLTVQGELNVNDYYSNNKLQKRSELRGKFINSVKSDDVEDKAEFDVEIYINKMKPEFNKEGVETGRLKLEGLTVGYNGIVSPIDFTVTDEFGVADYMTNTFQIGDTISVWGKIINSAISKTEIKQGFGKSKEDITKTYKNEILINGGEEYPLDEIKAFNPELISKALNEREIYLAQVEEEGKKKTNQPKRMTGFGGTKNRINKPIPPEKRTADDIPF